MNLFFRRLNLPRDRAPILRYGVAVSSVVLALIPALLISDVVESRLIVFAVAIMVSAWYGGWKPGLVATSFALTVSAYFSIVTARVPTEYHKALLHLTLFAVVAVLICWFNAAWRSTQEELFRSESKLRSLVTNAPYGICRCDAGGTLLEVNPALVTTLGYDSSSELVGRNLADLHRDRQQWAGIAEHVRSRNDFQVLAAEWKKKEGNAITVELSGRAISGQYDAIFFEVFIEDVTERQTLETQLRQAQKLEALGRLAGGIAHDFNNLLMVISGYSEFLLESVGSNSAVRESVEEIANAAERASALTRQVLAFSRKQMLAPRVLNLNAIVTENLKMLSRTIGEDITLVMLPGKEIGATRVDSGQIEQVIMNLAVNARDAMPQGGTLAIETANVLLDHDYARLHPPATPGEYVMLAVSDTGIGMDGETQSHIFEPFFTTKGLKGTGLGLSTVYGIIRQSGGYISVSSEPNKGTSFKIYLPRVSATGEAVA